MTTSLQSGYVQGAVESCWNVENLCFLELQHATEVSDKMQASPHSLPSVPCLVNPDDNFNALCYFPKAHNNTSCA